MNFNRLFLKLNQFICNELPVLPDLWASVSLNWVPIRQRSTAPNSNDTY